MKTKRLFIFAAYDIQGVIDDALLHYVRSLTDIGDVIFTMDNDVADSELNKIRVLPNVISVVATRHCEYDFGSYKRGFLYAYDNNLLSEYDWIYLVNDSVYGPLWDLNPVLESLESRGVDFTGMIDFENDSTPVQIQSWFIGMRRRLACESFVKDFMASVVSQENKALVVFKYEVGLSRMILSHGYQMAAFVSGQRGGVCHAIYDKPIDMLKAGIPFVKKQGLQNTGGLQYLYSYTTDCVVDYIRKNAIRTGVPTTYDKYENYFRFTLLGIPVVKIMRRQIKHCLTVSYRVCLFDFLPIFKISITPRANL